MHKIAILGSTGSIGTQALDIARANPDKISVEVLTAHSNAALLIQQAIEFNPKQVVIADENKFEEVRSGLANHDIKVYAGSSSIADIMEITDADTVLTAMVGYSGLKPTISAIRQKKRIALANKETLVVAGALITQLCQEYGVQIIPVDSEHSAIFQCLVGEDFNTIEKLILTASGGPFRGWSKERLETVTREQALKHPNWTMGAKITIDSATLMNKGLEIIEAKWLFGVEPDKIDVVVHPQSIIHSMVQFNDGSIKAQMGLPDMKLPIHYAFFYPDRMPSDFKRMDFQLFNKLDFEKPDKETFYNLQLAYDAMHKGGNAACVLNAANEIAVEAFLKDKIRFAAIAELNHKCTSLLPFIKEPTLEDLVSTDAETRRVARELSGLN